MSWQLVDNEAYAGQTPRKLTGACHDGSPFVTIQCDACHAYSHIHETQVQDIDTRIGMRCVCGTVLEFPVGCFERAFAEMRRQGWLADRDDAA